MIKLRKLILAIGAILCLCLGVMADDAYQLWVNGAHSRFAPINVQDQLVVPLNFPISQDDMEWTVSLHRDAKTHKVEVQMSPKRPKTRGDNQCHVCLGTGKCQSCYPAGSGNNTAGDPDYMCTATGKCWYCKGEGKW
jgi:hypothetical protein